MDTLVYSFEATTHNWIKRFVLLKTKNVARRWMNGEILQLPRRVRRLRRSKKPTNPEILARFIAAKEQLRLKSSAAKDFYLDVQLPSLPVHYFQKIMNQWCPTLSMETSESAASLQIE